MGNMTSFENVTGPIAFHAEGPVWSPSWGGLRYVDLVAGDLLTLTDSGEVARRHVGKIAAFHRPRAGGGFVVALERCLAICDAEGDELRILAPVWEDGSIRFNDGAASPEGTLYGGSMAYAGTPGAGTLYRFSSTLTTVDIVAADVTVSNGLAFSPDGRLAYYADTPTRRIDVFDNVEDRLISRRPLTHVEGEGQPDGLCVDAEGGIWAAMYGGSAVHRYGPDGTLTASLTLPVSNVTACTFGGPDLRTLFVTTTRENVPEGEQPEAGSVFATDAGVAGLPVLTVSS